MKMLILMRIHCALAVLAVGLALSACSTAPAAPETQVVEVPVPVGCLGDVPARPVAQYGHGPYPGDALAVRLALQDANAFERYATGLEVAMAGCVRKAELPGDASAQPAHAR